MSEIQNLQGGGLLEELTLLSMDFPRAYDVLSNTLPLQPVYDPNAGYGVLQAVAIWAQLELSPEDGLALLTLTNDDPALLYLALRAYSFRHWPSRENFLQAVRDDKIKFSRALTYTRKFIRNFGGTELTSKVNKRRSHGKHSRRRSN